MRKSLLILSAALMALIPMFGLQQGPLAARAAQGAQGAWQPQSPQGMRESRESREQKVSPAGQSPQGMRESREQKVSPAAQTPQESPSQGSQRPQATRAAQGAQGARQPGSQQPGSQQPGEKKTIDFDALIMRSVSGMPDSVMRLIGNVVLHHNGAVLTCDSAYRFGDKHFECYGRVLINKDSTFIYGDKAIYDGFVNTARVFAPLVKVVDGDAVLYTFNFSFNTLDNIGRYWGRGTMTQKENRLESQRGYYYADTREFVCVEKVEATDPEYKMASDSVRYNMDSETAEFHTYTVVWNIDDEILSATRGTYHNADARYEFTRDTYLLTKTREVLCDSLDYDSRPGNAVMMSNIQMRDDEQKIMAFGDYGRYAGEHENAMMTRNPSMLSFDPEQDTIYMRSDTMFLYSIAYELDFRTYDSLRRTGPADIGVGAQADSTQITLPDRAAHHREGAWPEPESPGMREALREMVAAQKYALFEQGAAITRESLTPEMVDSLLNTGYSSEDIEGQLLYNERKRELEEQGLPVTQSLAYEILESIGAFGNPLPPSEPEIIRDSLLKLEAEGKLRDGAAAGRDSTVRKATAEGSEGRSADMDSDAEGTVSGTSAQGTVAMDSGADSVRVSDAERTTHKDSLAGDTKRTTGTGGVNAAAGADIKDSDAKSSETKDSDAKSSVIESSGAKDSAGMGSAVDSSDAGEKQLSRRERRRLERERGSTEKQAAKSETTGPGSAGTGSSGTESVKSGSGSADSTAAGSGSAGSTAAGSTTVSSGSADSADAAQNVDTATLRGMLEGAGIDMDGLLEEIRQKGMSALTDTLVNKLTDLGIDPLTLIPQGFKLPSDSLSQAKTPHMPPSLPAVEGLDSLAVAGLDSLGAAPPAHDSLQRVIFAYNNVRIFRNDMQAVCDSMVVFSKDSTAHLYIDPIMWNKQNQITAEVIDIYTKNQQIERAFFSGWPLMVSEVDSTQFNQIKGREMESFFRDDEIFKHIVTGNAQTLYYMLDDDSGEANTFMVVNSSSIAFIMEDQQIVRITWFKDNDAVGYPIDQIPLNINRFLDGFRWEIKRKPGLKDVFDRTIRPSRREHYESLPHPIFPITDFIEQEKKRLTESGVWEDRVDTLPPHAIEFLRLIGVTR